MKMKHLLKKAFLLLALVGGVNSAWGSTVDDLVAISSDYTLIADNITSNGTVGLIKNTLYDSDRIFSPLGNSVATNKGNSTIGGVSHLNSLRVKSSTQDVLAFKVSGACTMTVYAQTTGKTGDSARPIKVGNAIDDDTYGTISDVAEDHVVNIPAAGVVYLTGTGDRFIAGFELTFASAKTATSEVLKSSSAVKVGETTLTKDAGTNGYSVDGTTITLSNDIAVVSAPTNVKLVKTVTYDDESTDDEDVDVTFDGTVTAGYYIGTASVGLTGSVTDYTVKVKKNVNPTAELSETSGTISMANSYTVIGSKTVTLTGGNLTDGEYEVTADQAGTTISPSSFTIADGSVSQEFTITTSGSSAATTVFTFGTSGMGVAAPTYTLTYETVAKRSLSQSDVSAATTWDWTKAGSASIQLTAETSPTKSVEFLLSDLQEMPNDANFNSQALKVVCEWPNRGSNSYIQCNSIKFNATVPGTVQVWFSNTSKRDDTSANRRYLYVNNTNSNVYTLNTDMTNTSPMPVSAGEVVINALTGEEDPTMVRISKIIFTPGAKLNGSGYATFSAGTDMHIVSGATAYKAKLDFANNLIACEEIADGDIPAGAGVLLFGDANEQVVMSTTTGVATLSDNDLKGTTKSDGTLAEKGNANTYYALSGNTFKTFTGDAFVHNKAYFEVNGSGDVLAREMTISFDGLTGIDKVENGEAKSSLPEKRIVNGNLVIEKGGQMFNANGQLVK